MIVVKVAKVVNYQCGCLAEYVYEGYGDTKVWKVATCQEHKDKVTKIQSFAEVDYARVVDQEKK